MIQVRKAGERGKTSIDWLKSFHTFSFGDYYHPEQMGFGPLRVINEDFVEPKKGFGAHDHANMEIITIGLEGELSHVDSSGGKGVTKAGEIQVMSAGSGVTHSEMNTSDKVAHFLQIWIEPRNKGGRPWYKKAVVDAAKDKWVLLVGAKAIEIDQDAELFWASMEKGSELDKPLKPSETAWLQVVKGKLTFGGVDVAEGDGVAIDGEKRVSIRAKTDAQVLLFVFN